LELNSQFVNFVRFSTFETARIRLGTKSQIRPPALTPPLTEQAPTACRSIPTDSQPRGATHTSPCHTPLATTTLHSHNTQPTGCVALCARVPQKEVKREERKRSEVRGERERRVERTQQRGRPPSKPPTPPQPTKQHEGGPPPTPCPGRR
jgi:hypothetical protein